MCYDNDEAGKKAALRNIEILTDFENRVKVVEITGAKDPDEYILKMGTENFKALLKSAKPALEYRILTLKSKYDLTETSGKVDFLSEAAELLAGVSNNVEREIYVRNISRETEISEKAIFTEINKHMSKNIKALQRKEKRASAIPEEITEKGISREERELAAGQNLNTYKAERMLLNLVFYNKQAMTETEKAGGKELFSSELNRRLYGKIAEFKKEGSESGAAEILSQTEEELKKTMTAVLFSEFEMEDYKAAACDVIKKLKGEQMKSKIDSLVKEGNLTEAMRLIKLKKEGGNL